MPELVTEQYPKGLGRTVPEVSEHLDVTPIEKLCFSAVDADEFAGALHDARRDQVLLCGIESHVCVNQTADDLLTDGSEVHVAAGRGHARAPTRTGRSACTRWSGPARL